MQLTRFARIVIVSISTLIAGCTNEHEHSVADGFPLVLTNSNVDCVLAHLDQRSDSTKFRYSVVQAQYPLMEYSEVVGIALVAKDSMDVSGYFDLMSEVQKDCYAVRALSVPAAPLRALIASDIEYPTSDALRAVIDGDRITIFFRDNQSVNPHEDEAPGI